jgi:hypothetical protein
VVFSDNFTSGNFNQWTTKSKSTGASQSVSNGIAQFNTPSGGNGKYSYVQKSSFTSKTTSVITATQDVYLSVVPSGLRSGSGTIYILTVKDTTGITPRIIQVSFDGSQKWALSLGTFPNTYTTQTSGSNPQSKTWYHLELKIDNPNHKATLSVNGTTVLSVTQTQFTDRTHTISLSVGIVQDNYNNRLSHQLQVDNVKLSIPAT